METTKKIATITLIILLAVIAYGFFRTGRSTTASQTTPGGEPSQAAHESVIDQTPLDTTRRLMQMPTSADELPLAQEALRLGDREMDLAFAAAVSEARMHPVVLSAEAKQIQARLQTAEKSLDGDNARVAQLTAALAKATGAKQDSLDDQLAQAKVQAELDQDEVDNAKQELTRPDRCPSAAPTEPYRTGVVLINYLRAVFDPFRLDGEVPLIQAARSLPRHVELLEKGWLRLCSFGLAKVT